MRSSSFAQRLGFAALVTATLSGPARPAFPDPPRSESVSTCLCAQAARTNGWCSLCKVGYVAGVIVPSAILFEALDAHGHDFEPARLDCDGCRNAVPTQGFCTRHRIGFVNGQLYASRLTYLIALGQVRHPADLTCERCRRNTENPGWCDRCRLGMVGNVSYRDRTRHGVAAREFERLRAAVATLARCEWCAVALFSDSVCPRCRVSYRGGKAEPIAGERRGPRFRLPPVTFWPR